MASTLLRHAVMFRRKRYLGMKTPGAGSDGYEKWVRFVTEVPPEIASELYAAQKKSMGINWDGYKTRPASATRANLVRSALLLYLEKVFPEQPEAVDSTAEEMSYADEQSLLALPNWPEE